MPGGPPGLQNRWTARRAVGGFDSRPPPRRPGPGNGRLRRRRARSRVRAARGQHLPSCSPTLAWSCRRAASRDAGQCCGRPRPGTGSGHRGPETLAVSERQIDNSDALPMASLTTIDSARSADLLRGCHRRRLRSAISVCPHYGYGLLSVATRWLGDRGREEPPFNELSASVLTIHDVPHRGRSGHSR